MASIGGEEGHVQACGLAQLQVILLAQQVCPPHQLIQAAHAQPRQPHPYLLGHKGEEVHLQANDAPKSASDLPVDLQGKAMRQPCQPKMNLPAEGMKACICRCKLYQKMLPGTSPSAQCSAWLAHGGVLPMRSLRAEHQAGCPERHWWACLMLAMAKEQGAQMCDVCRNYPQTLCIKTYPEPLCMTYQVTRGARESGSQLLPL